MGILFPKTGAHQKTVYGVGGYVDGRWVDETTTTTNLTADIQPMSGEEVESLNIGDRNLGKIKIYCDDVLNISDETTGQKGDIITWDANGENYEVISEQVYNNGLIEHIKYIGELRKNDNR